MRLLADQVRATGLALAPGPHVPVIVADDVAQWLAQQRPWRDADAPRPAIDLATELLRGPLALAPPPYPEFWIESTEVAPGDTTRTPLTTGALCTVTEDEVRAAPWVVDPRNRHVWRSPALARWHIDEGGHHDAPHGVEVLLDASALASHDPETAAKASSLAATTAFIQASIVIAACAFMVCRNVSPTPVTVPPAVAAKRSRRLGVPATTEFSRLDLPGFDGWRTAARLAAGAGAQDMPLHLVRSHPKTYTDEAPLFGRHAGTWLWSPQVRGNPERGRRVPLVDVQRPAAQE